ncbi:twin-arginine translocase subunit TatC [Putridiphycobacter roseus]|uniref:Sec-independent protein translocase protein TatC n=1 Tax=Putridiphycobacter roseus TaxID=2219161 RepID=A0A2W1NB11_9FLAO|nr:twin-arginine translocase subunit TatC [Putridiphycobacter roseus]PZE16243.1 twin-arginine translocase subunit TatC [Putridiphycobacter roseus]
MEEEEENMSFLGHLEELRWRLVKAVIAVLLVAIVVFIFRQEIIDTLFIKLKSGEFPTFKLACEWFGICFEDVKINFQNTALAGQFGTSIKMALVGGFIGAFPFVFYQIWGFVKPGLKKNERKSFRGITFFISILFFIGVLFGYYVIAPLTVNFLGNFLLTENAKNDLIISDFISTIISTIILTGVIFLLPVFILIFSKIGIITSDFLKKYRKHSIVVVLLLAAIITPPDVFTQIIVTIPIMFLYEFGIFIAKRIEKKRRAAELKQ